MGSVALWGVQVGEEVVLGVGMHQEYAGVLDDILAEMDYAD